MCHKRCVPALDGYWDTLQSIILPRFEYVFRLNINSIRDCDPTKFNREMGPHYVSAHAETDLQNVWSALLFLDNAAICGIQCGSSWYK